MHGVGRALGSLTGGFRVSTTSRLASVSHTSQHNPIVVTESRKDGGVSSSRSAMDLVGSELDGMFKEIHSELDAELLQDSELRSLAKYYFDGQGKAIRPVIALTLAHAVNQTLRNSDNLSLLMKQQRRVAVISEMIHTASLVHDDILDKANTRRGKAAVNRMWNATKSTMAGDYIIAVGSKLIAQIGNEDVVVVLAQVLSDLVRGEFQQLQGKDDEAERFQLYLNKTFNKTASLIAYSCKANAILSVSSQKTSAEGRRDEAIVDSAYGYGRNIGIAFQLVDDLLDFVASSEQLGKPAAADMKLGLATAPVLFASAKFPELHPMISRRFGQKGDVEAAFELVLQSDGLDRTKELAGKHCQDALNTLDHLADSEYKDALVNLTDVVVTRMK